MKKVDVVVRILLGLMMLVFGLNKFLNFMPMEPANENVGVAFGALLMINVLPVVAIVEIVAGVLLLVNRAVPFALVLLAPVALGALLFHGSIDVAGIGGALMFALFTSYLMFRNKEVYVPLLK